MVQSVAAPVALTREPLYLCGIELYQAGEFFTCHEVLEELWTPMRGPHRLFLQALIHFAVAFYHQQRRNPLGAHRQWRKALRKIERYLPLYEGAGEIPETPSGARQGIRRQDRRNQPSRDGGGFRRERTVVSQRIHSSSLSRRRSCEHGGAKAGVSQVGCDAIRQLHARE